MSDTIVVYILNMLHTHTQRHTRYVCGCWKRPLEVVRFPGTGVTGGCEHKT